MANELAAFASREAAAEGDELPGALATKACEGFAAAPRPEPGPATLRGASEARVQAALGRAGALQAALRANDLGVADRAVRIMEETAGLAVPFRLEGVAKWAAVRVLIGVQEENARRERGEYPPLEHDPAIRVPMIEPADPARAPSAVFAAPEPLAEAPLVEERTVSALMADWIEKSRKSRRRPVSNKVLRDRKVACDPSSS